MSKIKAKLSRLSLFVSDIKPIFLSHHPDCDHFSKHVYHVGKYKLCIGCFTYYPTVLITIILTILFVDLNINDLFILHFLSYLFFTPLILNILKFTEYKILKILTKVSIGIGTGFYIVSVLFLPIFLILKVIMLIQINFFTGVIAYVRVKHIEKQCSECEYKGDWDLCPSMKPIMDKLKEHNFKKKIK